MSSWIHCGTLQSMQLYITRVVSKCETRMRHVHIAATCTHIAYKCFHLLALFGSLQLPLPYFLSCYGVINALGLTHECKRHATCHGHVSVIFFCQLIRAVVANMQLYYLLPLNKEAP
jgi:hypothetical protein